MIDHEIDRITSAIHRLRPDWPIRQLDTLIRDRLADRPRRDVAVALTWIACETATTTPYRVLETGPWWIAVAVDGQTTGRREQVTADDACHECGQSQRRCTDTNTRSPDPHTYESELDYRRRLATDTPKPPLRQHTTEETP